MKLDDSDFALFGLPERFAQERAAIDARWKELQREVHPDRFAAQGATAQRVAMQWSVRINEAYRRLKDPVARAVYLCELRGAPIEAERNTAMPAAFLMEQMELREALEEATTIEALEAIHDPLSHSRREALGRIEQLLDRDNNPAAAAEQVRGLMFIERFAHELEHKMDQLGQ